MNDSLITKAEAAKLLSVSVHTISRMINSGRLVAVKVGIRRVGVSLNSVNSIINNNSMEK